MRGASVSRKVLSDRACIRLVTVLYSFPLNGVFSISSIPRLPSMSSLAKRLGLGKKSSNVIDGQTVSPESGSSSDVQVTSDVKDEKGLNLGVDQSTVVKASGTDRRISEAEANHTLQQIKSKHRWDPNLPEELEDEIEEKTDEHNLAGELRLVDELVENSPYPEVRAAVRNVSIPIRNESREGVAEVICSMTMRSLSTRSAPGFSVCS